MVIHDEGVQEERKCKLNEAICLVLIFSPVNIRIFANVKGFIVRILSLSLNLLFQ